MGSSWCPSCSRNPRKWAIPTALHPGLDGGVVFLGCDRKQALLGGKWEGESKIWVVLAAPATSQSNVYLRNSLFKFVMFLWVLEHRVCQIPARFSAPWAVEGVPALAGGGTGWVWGAASPDHPVLLYWEHWVCSQSPHPSGVWSHTWAGRCF